MTLTSHAVAGAAVASFFPKSPVLAFVFGFLSHFVLDAIPHGHYKINSYRREGEDKLTGDIVFGKEFIFDVLKVAADGTMGLTLAYLFFAPAAGVFIVLLGASAGMLPDFLQVAYFKIHREPLTSYERLHTLAHVKPENEFGFFPSMGLLMEVAVIIFAILIAKTFGA